MSNILASFLDAVRRIEPQADTNLELVLHENARGTLCVPGTRDPIAALMAQLNETHAECRQDRGPEKRLTLRDLTEEDCCPVCAVSVLDLLSSVDDDELRAAAESVARLRGLVPTVVPTGNISNVEDIDTVTKLVTGFQMYQDVIYQEFEDLPEIDNDLYANAVLQERYDCVERLQMLHANVFGNEAVRNLLRRTAVSVFGVEPDEESVVQAFDRQQPSYVSDQEDEDPETDRVSPENPMRYARVLQGVFVPNSYQSRAVERVPSWVEQMIRRHNAQQLLSCGHMDVSEQQLDTAKRLWCTDSKDIYESFDLCVAASRHLCPTS